MSNTEREDFDIGEWCKSKGLSNETIGKLVENEVTTKGTLESLTETDIIDLKLIIGQRALFRRAQKKMTSAEVRLEVPKEGSEEMKSHLNNLCHSPPSMHHDEASKMANTDRPTPAGVSKSETDPLPVSVEEDTKTENVQKKTQSDCEEDMDEGVSNPHEDTVPCENEDAGHEGRTPNRDGLSTKPVQFVDWNGQPLDESLFEESSEQDGSQEVVASGEGVAKTRRDRLGGKDAIVKLIEENPDVEKADLNSMASEFAFEPNSRGVPMNILNTYQQSVGIMRWPSTLHGGYKNATVIRIGTKRPCILTNCHVIRDLLQNDAKNLSQDQIEIIFHHTALKIKKIFYLKLQNENQICFHFSSAINELDFAVLELEESPGMPESLSEFFDVIPKEHKPMCIMGHPNNQFLHLDPLCSRLNINGLENVPVFMNLLHQGPNDLVYESCMYHGSSGSPVITYTGRLLAIHTRGFVHKGKEYLQGVSIMNIKNRINQLVEQMQDHNSDNYKYRKELAEDLFAIPNNTLRA